MQTYKKNIKPYLILSFILLFMGYILGNWAFSAPGGYIYI